MIESVIGDGARARLDVPEQVASGFAETAQAVTARAGLVWGEHCSECAYPICYSTCAFYTPRGDLHCRRFAAGFEPLEGRRGLHRVRFRKWGKLEAKGPATLRDAQASRRGERGARALASAANAAPLPYGVERALTWRLNLRREADARSGEPVPADASFVLEAWSADGRTHPMTLTFLEQDGAGMVQIPFTAGPAYDRLLVSAGEIAARVPLDRPFLVQIEPVGEAEGREIVFGLCDFARLDLRAPAARRPSAAAGEKPVKVVVWDLDETLWHGTLAESGPDGVEPRPEAVALVRALDERGVLQSIASKNDAAEAQVALQRFGLADYFLHPQVGWGPKSDSLRRLAALLDLGLDSFVFIDDQAFERGEVQAACPEVRTATHEDVGSLIGHAWFDLPVTAESRGRRAMYQAEGLRRQTFESSGSDYLAFLRGCGITLDARALASPDVERVYELSQRTNQLNFNGTKFSRDQVEALVGGDKLALTVRVSDRFGDYGLVGFAVADPVTGVVEDFFMSCRVQRKRVEHAVFTRLADALRSGGHDALRVRFRRTDRNKAGRDMLLDLGFAPEGEEDGLWARDLSRPFADADVVASAPPHLAAAA